MSTIATTGYRFPIPFKRQLRPLLIRLRYRGLSPEDALIACYPRSGSTWLRFLLLEALTGVQPTFRSVNERIPYVGKHHSAPPLLSEGGRVVKTHERHRGAARKVVYVIRDARSVVLSEFRQKKRSGYTDELDGFVDDFLDGRLSPFGTWDSHIRFWLDDVSEGEPRPLVVKYEDLRRNTEGVLAEILDYLHVPYEQEVLREAVRNNLVAKMKQKEKEAPDSEFRARDPKLPFIGKGSADEWREVLEARQVRDLEAKLGVFLDRFGYQLTVAS